MKNKKYFLGGGIAIILAGIIGAVIYFYASLSSGQEVKQVRTMEDLAKQTESVGRSEVLIIGVDAAFPPVCFTDEKGNLQGFDIDLINAIEPEIGKKIIIKPIAWGEKDELLNKKEIDALMSGIQKNKERLELYTWSKTYLETKILTVVANSSNIYSISDLSNVVIGTQEGSTYQSQLTDALAIDGITAQFENTFRSSPEALSALLQGKIDAAAMDDATALYYSTNSPKKFRLLDSKIKSSEIGIAVRKGNNDLADNLNKALEELKSKKEIQKIRTKWLGN